MANEALVAQAQSLSPTEILEKVDAFYKTSWDHLLTYGTIAGWVIGVTVVVLGGILPVLLQIAQTRAFKREEATIAASIKAQVEAARAELAEAYKKELVATLAAHDAKVNASLEAIKQDYANQIAQQRRKTRIQYRILRGGVFFVQGNTLVDQKRYLAAAESFAAAIEDAAIARDELNLRRAGTTLIDNCLPHINKTSLEAYRRNLPRMIARVERVLKRKDRNGGYRDLRDSLHNAMAAAQQREPVDGIEKSQRPKA